MDGRMFQIAGKNIRLNLKERYTYDLCKSYEIDNRSKMDYFVEVSNEEIEREAHGEVEKYSKGHLESLAVYRKMCEQLLSEKLFLFHCSAVALDGEGYLFTAPSGTGKSTQAALWRKRFGNRCFMINDDKPLLQVLENQILVHGTPWSGKHRIDTNTCVPVKAIIAVKRGKEPKLSKLSKMESYPLLFQQTYRPREKEKMKKTLELINVMVQMIPVYQLDAVISEESVRVAYKGIQKDLGIEHRSF